MNDLVAQNGHYVRVPVHRQSIFARVAGVATERIVDTVDPDIVLDHVDIDALVARIDVDALLTRIDVNAVLERVDIERLIARIDLQSVVERAGVPDLVAASTGQFAESGLDFVRRQVAGLDLIMARVVDRLLRRPPRTQEESPSGLGAHAVGDDRSRITVTGHYAGAVSRSLAALVDVFLVTATYTLGIAAGDYLLSTLGISMDVPPVWSAIAICCWAFVYVLLFVTIAGRTPGKWLLGLRVVRTDGSFVPAGRSFVRAVLWWPSTLVAAITIWPVILLRRHRAVHDYVAGTAVVHDWGDRPAELPAPLSAYLGHADATS